MNFVLTLFAPASCPHCVARARRKVTRNQKKAINVSGQTIMGKYSFGQTLRGFIFGPRLMSNPKFRFACKGCDWFPPCPSRNISNVKTIFVRYD